MEILTVRNVSFTYPECPAPAVREVSLSIEKGSFTVICGATGSGKSTLLRLLKPELAPLGEMSGEIVYPGCGGKMPASEIGFVMQKPEQQIVTDKVWHELAFGLENMGIPQEEMHRRIAETVSFFGIGDWYGQDTSKLSGGQKQLLSLASVLVMRPEILILDEPTAQLDPIAAADFIGVVRRLNQELGLTVIMAEHRLEEAVPICDRLIIMERGGILVSAAPGAAVTAIRGRQDILLGMPAAARLFAQLGGEGECPLDVRQGRAFLENNYKNNTRSLPVSSPEKDGVTALEFRDVYFRYSREGRDILSGMSMKVHAGRIYCILGGNGSGKTTSLSAAAGLIEAYSGSIFVFGKKISSYRNRSLYRECLAMLPQDVQTVFLKNTLREELEECGAELSEMPALKAHLEGLLDKHPYDLSGGQQQLAALAKVLAARPKLLLLDEPTKGLDAAAKQDMLGVMRELKKDGVTIVAVTHDVEFASQCADRCGMFFGGKIVSEGTPHEFFPRNMFYTTAVCRMTRGFFEDAVTVEDALSLCRTNGRRGTDA